MRLVELMGAMAGVNLCAVKLAFENPRRARGYLSHCLRKYDEMVGRGLPKKDPVNWLCEEGMGEFRSDERVELPTRLADTGGTSLSELLVLATVTRVLKPKKIFEIGTFTGRTTSVFILNAPENTTVVTLDLPPLDKVSDSLANDCLETDMELVKRREVASFVRALHLQERCDQVLCDSLEFDPSPHSDSVELGFIDGAHALEFVRNDTIKMARMIADPGIVFWHDYGGKGNFRPLADYLEGLARKISIYRVAGTTLAWAPAKELRKII